MKLHWLFKLFAIVLFVFVGYYLYLDYYPVAEKTAFLMNTPVRIKVEGRGAPMMVRDSLAEIKKLDKLFNKYNPASEVARLNRASSEEPQEISDETAQILALSVRMKKETSGTFDIALGGQDEFKNPIDLGGIAKGFAVDKVRALLLKRGAKSAIIDMRSSIGVIGSDEFEIGVQHPRQPEKLLGTVTLTDGQSLSTSGDYERGKHILDPRTGRPADLCQSVTVIGPSAAEADALSTAIFVLGPKAGLKLADDFGVQVVIVDKEGKVHGNFSFKLR
ncbi:MAG: FAD:protein FMN transferase [bacterium]